MSGASLPLRAGLGTAIVLTVASCVAPSGDRTADGPSEVVQPLPTPRASPPPPPIPSPTPTPAGPTTFLFAGELTQGGWMRGQAPAGTVSARLGDQPLTLDPDGRFFAAFDRDAGPSTVLVAKLADGRTVQSPIVVRPREWDIERIDLPRTPGGGPTEAFMKLRRPELAQIGEARSEDHDVDGWAQDFVWPVTGRISGRFGSQRVYRGGEADSYHTGIDIATGESGTPIVAPADGVVVLAAIDKPFTLEGHLLMIDHGHGLNSAFLHLSKIAVRVGERVNKGQYIGNIGSSGRATGPHLHWSLKWRDARLDPLLFTGPMK